MYECKNKEMKNRKKEKGKRKKMRKKAKVRLRENQIARKRFIFFT
jgi:hypothetical protein